MAVWAVLIVLAVGALWVWFELGRLRRDVAQIRLDQLKAEGDRPANRPMTFEEARKEKEHGTR